jgi:hypothetical protein
MATARTGRVTSRVVILKGKDGLRYIGLITSNAYADRDGEIVAEDALKAWVNSVWKGGAYRASNPLLFWHAGQPIGDVIWSDMRGAFLIEIAKERRTPFARLIFNMIERGDIEWGVSHGFRDKAHDWDGRWKVYRRIAKKETSVLPLVFAANPFTSVKVKSMNLLRLGWLKKNAPDAAALEKRLTTDAKERQSKLERAGVTRKEKQQKLPLSLKKTEKPSRKSRKEIIEEKAIDPASLAENLTSFLDDVFAESGVEAPEDLNDRIAALIEALDGGEAPLDAEMVAETIADASEELLAEEGAEAPDDLQEQIAGIIDEEEAVEAEEETMSARKRRVVVNAAEKQRTEKQTELLEALLDDLSVLDEIAEVVKSLKPLIGLGKDMATVKKELRLLKRKMSGGPRAASGDDETEVGDDADEEEADDVAEFKQQIKRRKQKTRAEGMFNDLYDEEQ